MNFNPRSLTGATAYSNQLVLQSKISIHAPSRERQLLPLLLTITLVFQSTLPHGSDLVFQVKQLATPLFQSTLPHGSDIPRRAVYGPSNHFNPRSLTGATEMLAHMLHDVIISIHAPSRERRGLKNTTKEADNFNPRSLTGATTIGLSDCMLPLQFQSTLPHGSDVAGQHKAVGRTISIHAPSRERLSCLYWQVYRPAYFNPRSLTGAT